MDANLLYDIFDPGLLEYARFHRVSVLIYSHNYTEIFGTRNLAERVAAMLGISNIFRLDEPHF